MIFAAVHESGVGTSRQFAAMHHFGRFRGEADIDEPPFGTNATSEDVFPPAGEEDEVDASQRLPL